ncbi:MAG: trypsin-like peptidase domain-containing protein [Rubrobacteraceae bacterium]|nr:trypsin-like peptidase domain-containing protein [Rubrobacteraceae bacterium]
MKGHALSLLFAVVVLFAVAVVAVYYDVGEGRGAAKTAVAAPEDVPQDEPVARVAAEVEPSVVQVNVSGVQQTPFGTQQEEGLGSGVIYREDGYIVTNSHVVQGATQVEVAFADGTTERGEVVGTDRSTDLAVIRTNRDNLPAASFGDGRDLLVGQLAVAIGSPSGFQSTVTSGIISGLGRELSPQLTGGSGQDPSLVDLIQTDAAVSPGSSGGALANRDGEVIGINIAYLPPGQTGAESIGFAIPSYTVVSVADQLIQDGKAAQPYLGIYLSDLTPEVARQFDTQTENGVLVEQVESGGPADSAGLKRGDIITALDSAEVRRSGDLLSTLRRYQPGDSVEVTILRGGKQLGVELRLGERNG